LALNAAAVTNMGLEVATYISGLNASNPVNATDGVNAGDDHLRLIKSTLLNSFPNITGAMNASHTELNHLVGITGKTGTGNVVLSASPTLTGTILAAAITASGTITGNLFSGSGASLTAIPASALAAGGSLPAINGSALTNLNASNLASGTVPDARFPATLPAASGVNLTALNGSNIASGTINNARLNQALSVTTSITAPAADLGDVEIEDLEITTSLIINNFITPTELGGGSSTDNYAPTGHATASVWRLSSGGAASLTGLAGGVDGRCLRLVNIGDFTITLLDENASSTAANRIRTVGAGRQIGENGGIDLWYDGTSNRWRVIEHE
jgi:hypothetical protein